MDKPIRLVLALHNHQPIGNFDGVIEQAYHESYLPFLDVFERFTSLRIALHTSGCLMEWLDQRHPDYVDRVARLAEEGRIEIIGGPFYEPILSMLPRADRIGQIRLHGEWIQKRLGAKVRGMWTPERVWEQSFTSDLADAGIEYTVLDDFHFRNSGLAEDELHGYYVTEDDGRLLKVFPGSERLRYLIPFQDPPETIEYLRSVNESHPGAVIVFGDDGEKFGTWPGTHEHVYKNGWLSRFFEALEANQDWLQCTTLADAVQQVSPTGKVYLPDASYREMTEWVLPTEQQVEYERVSHEMEDDPRWPVLKQFVRGGFWRNFKVKYPESDEMYSRMLGISRRLQAARHEGPWSETHEQARRALYRGQCNCGYWHGAFGGIYLPHLRNSIYRYLIQADNLLESIDHSEAAWVDAAAEDFNLDARQEVRLSNDKLLALLAPARGGHLYELDVRGICHNLLSTLSRRPEAYHRKVLAGPSTDGENVASIHDRIVFKQADLDQKIQYDAYPRKSLVDHFYDHDVAPEAIALGQAEERGDFLLGVYETRIRRGHDRVQVEMSRAGLASGHTIQVTKTLTLLAGQSVLEIEYRVDGLPAEAALHFSPEFGFAGLPAGADDRYFTDSQGQRLGQLGTQLDLRDSEGISLTDQWLGITVHLTTSQPGGIWTYPIETVSQSEGGFELVHQSVVVQPHWIIQGDAEGAWTTRLRLAIDTTAAQQRDQQQALEASHSS